MNLWERFEKLRTAQRELSEALKREMSPPEESKKLYLRIEITPDMKNNLDQMMKLGEFPAIVDLVKFMFKISHVMIHGISRGCTFKMVEPDGTEKRIILRHFVDVKLSDK